MTWQSFCHINAVPTVQFLLDSQAVNFGELGALYSGQETSQDVTLGFNE